MIEVKNLTKKFKNGEQEIVAINNLSFSVPSGQFLTISGRSGSGKSTLLYQMGLLDLPSEGEVYLDGVESINIDEETRTTMRLNDLGYIFQDYAIIPYLTALENTVLPLPDSPTSPKISLGRRLRLTPSTARITPLDLNSTHKFCVCSNMSVELAFPVDILPPSHDPPLHTESAVSPFFANSDQR